MNPFIFGCLIQVSVFLHNIVATPTRTSSHLWTCSPDSHFRYNHCHDPIHPGDTFTSTGNNVCNIENGQKRNLRRTSHSLNDNIQNSILFYETDIIKCPNIVQRLQRENLTNIIGLEEVNDISSAVSQNQYTHIYLKMSAFLRLYHKVWCLFGSKAVDECCLPFERIFHTVKHRLLSKWWNVQEMCGEVIDEPACESRVSAFTNTELTCEDIRNVIYILLRDTSSLLVESLSVVNQL